MGKLRSDLLNYKSTRHLPDILIVEKRCVIYF